MILMVTKILLQDSGHIQMAAPLCSSDKAAAVPVQGHPLFLTFLAYRVQSIFTDFFRPVPRPVTFSIRATLIWQIPRNSLVDFLSTSKVMVVSQVPVIIHGSDDAASHNRVLLLLLW